MPTNTTKEFIMRKTSMALVAALLLTSTAAIAGPRGGDTMGANGGGVGGFTISAQSNGVSRTSAGVRNGTQFIMNESSAGQLAGVSASVSMTQTDNGTREHGTSGRRNGVHTHTDNNAGDASVEVTVMGEAFADGYDTSRTVTRGNGGGARAGYGSAARAGSAGGMGSYSMGADVSVLGGWGRQSN
jgi:hypothetical protein